MGYFCESLLVFRGVWMEQVWIKKWMNVVGMRKYTDKQIQEDQFLDKNDKLRPMEVRFHGYTSFSESYLIAMK